MENNMEVFKVGEPYMGKRRGWVEGVQYGYDEAGHVLQLFFASPTNAEVEAARKGRVELALYHTSDHEVLMLAYRVLVDGREVIPWSDAPYSWHAIPAERRAHPPVLTGEQRPVLELHLVDTKTGLLRALRRVSMSPEFGRTLHAAISAQAARSPDPASYNARLELLYGRMDAATIAASAVGRCVCGL
jgi:hypothetical protein